MSIQDSDYILRMVRRMTEMIGRLMGLTAQNPDEARRALDDSGRTLFGPLYRTLREANAPTVAILVSDHEKRWALAVLLFEEGKLYEAKNEPRRAQSLFRTAEQILLDLSHTSEGLTEHAEGTQRLLAAHLDPTAAP